MFIRLTNTRPMSDIYINSDHISSFFTDKEGTRVFEAGQDETYWTVKETPKEIIQLIEDERNKTAYCNSCYSYKPLNYDQ